MNVEETLRDDLDRLAGGIHATGITPTTIRRRMQERVRRRRLLREVASGGLVVVVAIVLGPLGLLEGDDRRPVLVGPAAPTSTALPAPAGVRPPTLVAPTALPRGLQFIEGGSSTKSDNDGIITLGSRAYARPVQLTWSPLGIRGGCDELVATGPAPATDPRRSRAEAIRAYLDGTMNQIGWCEPEGTLLVVLTGSDLPRQELANLATTVARLPGEPADLTLVPPAGFTVMTGDRPRGLRSVLVYGPPGAAAPALRVEAHTAVPNALDRARADVGGELVTLGGRPALIGQDGIRVLYDDHTLVIVSGTALSDLELRRAAESLKPAPASMAPPLVVDQGDGRCDRLGLCG
jgi:hypothetical protein